MDKLIQLLTLLKFSLSINDTNDKHTYSLFDAHTTYSFIIITISLYDNNMIYCYITNIRNEKMSVSEAIDFIETKFKYELRQIKIKTLLSSID